jgi:hypothetical protein
VIPKVSRFKRSYVHSIIPGDGGASRLGDVHHIVAQSSPLGWGIAGRIPALLTQEDLMISIKKIIPAAIGALALAAASLTIPGPAFAGGHGHGHGHGGFGHGHGFGHGFGHGHGHFWGHHHHYRPFYVYNSCWKWTSYSRVNVCGVY